MDVSTIGHSFPFDPTYGYNLQALRAVPPPPAPHDFEAFWRDTHDRCRDTPLSLQRLPSQHQHPDFETFEIRFDTLGYTGVGAWVVIPHHNVDTSSVVVAGHGYGGRAAPDYARVCRARAPWIFPCAPGFHLSARDDFRHEHGQTHVTVGIQSRETYILRACVATFWSTLDAAQLLFPDARDFVYIGGSFGGGLGALMLPWEPRYSRAVLDVPTFGQQPIRLQCPCNGSGQGVIDYAATHPDLLDILAYYDAATAATHIAIPVITSPAQFDPCVAPPGQFAVANAITSDGSETIERHIGHFDLPEVAIHDQLRVTRAVSRFIGP